MCKAKKSFRIKHVSVKKIRLSKKKQQKPIKQWRGKKDYIYKSDRRRKERRGKTTVQKKIKKQKTGYFLLLCKVVRFSTRHKRNIFL